MIDDAQDGVLRVLLHDRQPMDVEVVEDLDALVQRLVGEYVHEGGEILAFGFHFDLCRQTKNGERMG